MVRDRGSDRGPINRRGHRRRHAVLGRIGRKFDRGTDSQRNRENGRTGQSIPGGQPGRDRARAGVLDRVPDPATTPDLHTRRTPGRRTSTAWPSPTQSEPHSARNNCSGDTTLPASRASATSRSNSDFVNVISTSSQITRRAEMSMTRCRNSRTSRCAAPDRRFDPGSTDLSPPAIGDIESSTRKYSRYTKQSNGEIPISTSQFALKPTGIAGWVENRSGRFASSVDERHSVLPRQIVGALRRRTSVAEQDLLDTQDVCAFAERVRRCVADFAASQHLRLV